MNERGCWLGALFKVMHTKKHAALEITSGAQGLHSRITFNRTRWPDNFCNPINFQNPLPIKRT